MQTFNHSGVQIESLFPTQTFDEKSRLGISCRELDWQLSSLAQVFPSVFPFIYTVEHLYIKGLDICHCNGRMTSRTCNCWNFSTHLPLKKILYVSRESAQCISPALQNLVGERVTGLLPALETLFGRTPATRTCPGTHWAVCCCPTAFKFIL